MSLEKELCCPRCGSDSIAFETWVDEHDNHLNLGDTVWCDDCCDSINEVIKKSEYKKEVA